MSEEERMQLARAYTDRLASALVTNETEAPGLSVEDQHRARWDALVAFNATFLATYWGAINDPDAVIITFAGEVGMAFAQAMARRNPRGSVQ